MVWINACDDEREAAFSFIVVFFIDVRTSFEIGFWVNVFDGEIIKGSVDTDFSNIMMFNLLTFDINKCEFELESVGYWTDKDYR